MATKLIRNGAFAGALNAIMDGRAINASSPPDGGTPATYATAVNAADAFASQFLTANAALSVPMADADNSEIGQVCEAAAMAALDGRSCTSATAADYAGVATAAVALAKQSVAKLV